MSHLKLMEELARLRANVANVAREMGDPLNVILGQAESLLRETDDPILQTALRSIVRQVERMIVLRRSLGMIEEQPGGGRILSEGIPDRSSSSVTPDRNIARQREPESR